MRLHLRSLLLSSVCFIGFTSLTEAAFAQEPPPPGGAQPSTTLPPPPPTPPPPPPPAPPTTATDPTPGVSPPPLAAATPAAGETKEPSLFDKINTEAFIDGYASLNWGFPKPQSQVNPAGGNAYRAYDIHNGFSLHWAGINASIDPDPIGGTVSLRLGPGTTQFQAQDNAVPGLQLVKQAYATWRPGGKDGKLTLDFGKYDQPFGSEVADSQYNPNYTRSFLYYWAQPLFFTGLRATYAVSDMLELKVLAANGWNNTVDNNRGKSFGAQINIKPNDTTLIALGYMGGPEGTDYATTTTPTGGTVPADADSENEKFKHFADLVVDVSPIKELRFLANVDYGVDHTGGGAKKWYGGNLAVRVAPTDTFFATVRGEYYADPDGFTMKFPGSAASMTLPANVNDINVISGTLTLGTKIADHLTLMLDNRVDQANERIFFKSFGDPTKTQITSTLGIIVSTKK